MDIDGFNYKDFLPYYLTEDQRESLAKAISDFSERSDLYSQQFQNETLQGDLWEGVPFIDWSGRKDLIKAVVLSNTCDIAPENTRSVPVSLTYAPLIGLDAYKQALLAAKISPGTVDDKIKAIRAQKLTNVMFFPASVVGSVDCLAVLDKAMSIPYKVFEAQAGKKKITALSQFGFYLFSFKLSIHFCRMHEGLARG